MYTKLMGILIAAFAGVFLMGSPALATDKPTFETCTNLDGWYANPDEQNDLPTPTADGLLFEGKDLIHHATNLALADVKTGGTFVADGDEGKVVFKMETDNPYSTIIQNADGKFWSSRIQVGEPGGQNNPVDKVTDMIGSEMKAGNPKYTNDTKVVTFGVGYWDEAGSTVVSSILFHGKTYSLTCPPPKASESPSAKPTTTAPTAKSTTVKSTATKTSSAAVAGGVDRSSSGPSLPVTGPSIGVAVGIGAAILGLGVALVVLTRRRKATFSA